MAKRVRPKLEVVRTVREVLQLTASKKDVLGLALALSVLAIVPQLVLSYYVNYGSGFVMMAAFYILLAVALAVGNIAFVKSAYSSMRGGRPGFLKNLAPSICTLPRLIGASILMILAIVPAYAAIGAMAIFGEQMSGYMFIATIVLFFVLMFAGVYALLRLTLSTVAIVVDNMGIVKSLRFSWDKTRDSILRIIAVYILIWIIASLLQMAGMLIFGISGFALTEQDFITPAMSIMILAYSVIIGTVTTTIYTFASLKVYDRLKR